MNNVGHKTTFAIVIICASAILSVFILLRKPEVKVKKENTGSLDFASVKTSDSPEIKNAEWSKVLSKSIGNVSTTTDPKINLGPDDFNPNLVTARMARDLFSRYLESSNSGQQITQDQVTQIVNDTLSNPDFSKIDGVVYVQSNLKTNSNNNSAGYKKYNLEFNQIMAKRMNQIQNVPDPMAIMLDVANKDDKKGLDQLDIIISTTAGLIDDLLKMQVPSTLVSMHLELLNSASSLLTDVKAMKNIYTDPVSSLLATSQYEKHMSDFLGALGKLDDFFKKI